MFHNLPVLCSKIHFIYFKRCHGNSLLYKNALQFSKSWFVPRSSTTKMYKNVYKLICFGFNIGICSTENIV